MKPFAFCSLLFAFCFSACAPSATNYNRGREALDNAEYEKALVDLRLAVKENPLNAMAVRDLGMALFETGNFKSAQLILEKAFERLPKDGLARLYLGMAYEKNNKLDDAIKLYRGGAVMSDPSYRRQIEARLDLAIQAKLRLEARQALASEGVVAPQNPPPRSVAVLNFRNLGGNAGFDPLAKGLADMVITDLSQVKSLTVIERSRMQALFEEMGLGQAGFVDEQTAPRVGQLLGVKKVLQGSFLDLAGGRLRLDANLADAANKAARPISETSGEMARFFRVEKNFVFKIIDEFGIKLTEAEEKAILIIPTENLLAFLAYARGLEARDRGDLAKAQEEFQQALKIDPKFNQAKTQLERASVVQQNFRERRAARFNLPLRPLAAQKRQARLMLSTRNTNPAFSFVNIGRSLTTAAKTGISVSTKDLRQPLLEGRSSLGLKGEFLIDVKLP